MGPWQPESRARPATADDEASADDKAAVAWPLHGWLGTCPPRPHTSALTAKLGRCQGPLIRPLHPLLFLLEMSDEGEKLAYCVTCLGTLWEMAICSLARWQPEGEGLFGQGGQQALPVLEELNPPPDSPGGSGEGSVTAALIFTSLS